MYDYEILLQCGSEFFLIVFYDFSLSNEVYAVIKIFKIYIR